MKNAYRILVVKPEREKQLADLGVDVSRLAFQNEQLQELQNCLNFGPYKIICYKLLMYKYFLSV